MNGLLLSFAVDSPIGPTAELFFASRLGINKLCPNDLGRDDSGLSMIGPEIVSGWDSRSPCRCFLARSLSHAGASDHRLPFLRAPSLSLEVNDVKLVTGYLKIKDKEES